MSGKVRQRVRVGLVGAGFVARLHAEAYRHVHGLDVELTCVAAARPERATQFAAEFGVGRVETDLAAVVEASDVDVVDLCAPSSLHARWRWRPRARAST